MPTKIVFSLFVLLFIGLFSNIQPALALYNAATDECEGGASTEYLAASVCEAHGAGSPPASQCNRGSPDWVFSYPVCKVETIPQADVSICDFSYTYQTNSCSATDSCKTTPYLYPGICNAGAYSPAAGPTSACQIGGTVYKSCCNSDGTLDGQCTGGNYSGSCPTGTTTVICGVSSCAGITAPCTTAACGQAACGTLVTCSVDNSVNPNPYDTCGQQGGCTDQWPANYTVAVTVSQCTDNSSRYSCANKGSEVGKCGNTPPCTYTQNCTTSDGRSGNQTCTGVTGIYSSNPSGACGYDTTGFQDPSCSTCSPIATSSSCSVSWSFSPSATPVSNTTVTATITGTGQTPADFPWSNVAYNIDGGSWTTSNLSVTSSSPPTYSASFNSGAPGNHFLQFSAHDAAGNLVICQGTGTVISQTPISCPAPPTGLSPNGTQACGLTTVTLRWNSIPNATGYNVRVDDGNDAVKTASGPTANNCSGVNYDICINNYQGTSMTITMTPGVNYNFWVHSYNDTCSPPESFQTNTSFSSPSCTAATVTGTAFCSTAASCQPNQQCDSQIAWQWSKCGTGSYTKLRLSDLTTSQFQDFTPSSNQTTFPSAGLTASHNFTLGVFDNSGGTNPTCLSAPVGSIDCSQPGGGPPAPTDCSICMSGNCLSSALSSRAGFSFDITSNKPTTPQTINIDGPRSYSYGPFSSTSQTITWLSDVSSPGTYTVSNGTCSRSITLAADPAACKDRGKVNITGFAFSDPTYDPSVWPVYNWTASTSSTCSSGGAALPIQSNLASIPNSSTAVLGASSGQVLAATSCWANADCNDNNVCTADNCNDAIIILGINILAGTCQNPPQQNKLKTVCGTSPNGGNMYCGAASTGQNASGVCVDNLCDSNKNTAGSTSITAGPNPECSDGNSCTQDTCTPPITGYDTSEQPIYSAGIGTCSYSPLRYGTVCSSNAYCGGNASTSDGDSICHAMPANAGTVTDISGVLCKTSTDCNDGNECTKDVCNGYEAYLPGDNQNPPTPEKLGTCSRTTTTSISTSNTNQPATYVCQKDASGNPLKLCTGGSDPGILPTTPGFQLSQCSVNWVNCTNPSLTPENSNNACCGTTNIQGKQCQGTCKMNYFPAWDPPNPKDLVPSLTPKAGIVVHADGNKCDLSYTGKTNADGFVEFTAVNRVGSSDATADTISYTIWAEIPTTNPLTQFTRGTCYKFNQSGPIPDPAYLVIPWDTNKAKCEVNLSGSSTISNFASFGFLKPLNAWIQTTGGDIYSNTINTPGGP